MKAAATFACACLLLLAGCHNEPLVPITGPSYRFSDGPLKPTSMVLPKSQRTCPYAYKPGVVDLAFIVEPDGSVSHIKILSENPRNCGYASDAIFAFRYWKFPPHMENGVAVAYPGTYTVNFDPLGLPAEPVK